MDVIIVPLLNLISSLLGLIQFLLFTFVIMDWLVKFGILNIDNRIVRACFFWLERLFNPILDSIRSILPAFGIDFSPIILFFLISFLQGVIFRVLIKIS